MGTPTQYRQFAEECDRMAKQAIPNASANSERNGQGLETAKPVASPPTSPSSSDLLRRDIGPACNLASVVSVYLVMKTLAEHSDNKRSQDRLIVERLQNAASQMRQSIVQTQAVIHEAQRLNGLAEKIGRPVIRNE